MVYSPIGWRAAAAPPISATYLDQMDQGIKGAHDAISGVSFAAPNYARTTTIYDLKAETNTWLGGTPNPSTLSVKDIDYGTTPDPLDATRSVAFFDSSRGHAEGTSYWRSEFTTTDLVKPRGNGNATDEYWSAFSIYLDPLMELTNSGDWQTIHTGAFGPPWGGASPLGVAVANAFYNGVYQGYNYLQIGASEQAIGRNLKIVFGEWLQVVMHYKVAYDGWLEVFAHRGKTGLWTRIPVYGMTNGPAQYQVLKAGVNDGFVTSGTAACYTSIGVYGWNDSGSGTTKGYRALFGHLRLGTGTSNSVNYAGNGWVCGNLASVAGW